MVAWGPAEGAMLFNGVLQQPERRLSLLHYQVQIAFGLRHRRQPQ